MKELKIPIGWLMPIIGLILLLGWFLGRSGWNITEVDTGIVKLAPLTTTPLTVSPPTSSTVQQVVQQPQPTPDLWQFYVDDIKSTIPNAPVTADTLKEIARKMPSSVPFLAERESGLPMSCTVKSLHLKISAPIYFTPTRRS